MRTVVVGMLALLLCGTTDAKPAKKRRGTFAGYIEPNAPDDPPRPPPPSPARDQDQRANLVIFVVDDTVEDLEAIKTLVTAATDLLPPNDYVAVVAFDSEALVYVRPTRASNRLRIANDLMRLSSGYGGNAYAGLKEAFEIARGIDATTKLVVLLTDGRVSTDGLVDLVNDMSNAMLNMIVVGTSGGERPTLYMIANSGNAPLFMLEDKPGDRALLDALRTIPRAKPKTSAAPRRRP